MINYGFQQITEADIESVTNTLKSDFLTQGPRVQEFENQFAKYVGAKYVVAVANATCALHLCALSIGVKPGSKVITTPITFAASANCIKYCGGEIEFCDIDPVSYNLDLEKLRKLLESSPKNTFSGIVSVDFAGNPVNLEELKKIATKYKIWIIEDSCHAPGGFFSDKKGRIQKCGNGNYADLAVFSFHPVKHIACGEGGMITTNNKALYEKLLLLRSHGITKNPKLLTENHGGWYYEMHSLGYNYRLSDIHASLGVSQLKRAKTNLKRREEIVKEYNKSFAGLPLVLPHSIKGTRHAYHLYIIQTKKRKELYDFLKTKNIFSQVHYIPLHLMPYYKKSGWKKGDMPVAEEYYKHCLSLPIYPSITSEQLFIVINSVKDFFVTDTIKPFL